MADRKNKQTKAQEPKIKFTALRALLIIGISVALLVLSVLGLYFLENRKTTDKGSSDVGDKEFQKKAELLFNTVREAEENPSSKEFINLDVISLEEAFTEYPIKDSYYCEYTAIRANGDDKHEQIKQVIKQGNKYNIRTYESEILIETLIFDGESIYVRNEITGETKVFADKTPADACIMAGIPCHEDVLRLTDSYRSSPDDSELEKCSYSLFRTNSNILIVTLRFKETAATHKYYYFLDYGIIYSCDIQANNIKPYTISVHSFDSDIKKYINEGIFAPLK